jgi:hypothetical protein
MTERKDETGIPVLIRADLHETIARLAKSKNRSVSIETNALLDYALSALSGRIEAAGGGE